MDDKTIVMLCLGLAVVAYYADPFGWTPNERHGSARNGAALAALLFAVAGLGWAHHRGLIETELLFSDALSRFDRTSERLQIYVPQLSPETREAIGEALSSFGSQIDEGARDLAHEVSEQTTASAGAEAGSETPPRS